MEPLFADAIQEHLELKRRNARLDRTMPLAEYRVDDVADHALFKSEREARLEESLTSAAGNDGWPAPEPDSGGYAPDQFWLPAPAFDWGD